MNHMEELTKNIELEAIKALFEMNTIKKLSQLEKLSPTKISKRLKINYGRYIEKLHHPELFALKELFNLAQLIDIDIDVLLGVVIPEVKKKMAKNEY